MVLILILFILVFVIDWVLTLRTYSNAKDMGLSPPSPFHLILVSTPFHQYISTLPKEGKYQKLKQLHTMHNVCFFALCALFVLMAIAVAV